MTLSGMSRAWMLPACVAALGAFPAGGAGAQDQQQYETPLYTAPPPTPLDQTFGLPTFGMPGTELPQQRTMASEREVPTSEKAVSAEADFFKGSSDIALPKARPLNPAGSDTETPLFTTSSDATSALAGETETASGDTIASDRPVTR